MQANRDQNRVTVLMGVSSADGVTPVPLRVDPITNALLVEVTFDSDTTIALKTPAKRDENRVTVELAVDTNGDVRPFSIKPSNNALYLTLN